MKKLLAIAMLLTACTAPHEGEFIGPFEGMLWPVTCGPDGLRAIYERWEYSNPNYCDAKLHEDGVMGYELCEEWMRLRYRFEWAKIEYRQKCERGA